MRPIYEHVRSPDDASWTLFAREQPSIPFEWHYHPEYELTLTLNGRGQRFVGDNVADFDDGDLVLLGPNLPHTWSAPAIDTARPTQTVVMWFTQDWADRLLRDFPELAGLRRLLLDATQGTAFSPAAGAALRAPILSMLDSRPASRLPQLLDILIRLSEDSLAHPLALAASSPTPLGMAQGERLDRVLSTLHADFACPVDIEQLAARASLSVGAFHRFFRRHLQTTVTAYVGRLRIGRACQQLTETSKPIGVIAGEVGYANLSHFNRQFRAVRGMTPRAYRLLHASGR